MCGDINTVDSTRPDAEAIVIDARRIVAHGFDQTKIYSAIVLRFKNAICIALGHC